MISKLKIINNGVLKSLVKSDKKVVVNFLNLHSFVMMSTNKDFADAVNSEYIAIDGRQIEKDLQSKGLSVSRLTGYQAVNTVFTELEKVDSIPYVAVLGGSSALSKKFKRKVNSSFKNLQFDMYPEFEISEKGEITSMPDNYLQNLNKRKYNLLLICFGAPKQELFCQRYKDFLDAKMILNVGAVVDYVANDNYPHLFSKLGVEWCYRLLIQPHHIWRRVFISGLKYFIYLRKNL